MIFLRLTGILALICLVRSESIQSGKCTKVYTNFTLDMNRIVGSWYLIASTKFTGAPVNPTCVVCNKTLVDNTIVVNSRSYDTAGGPEMEWFHGIISEQDTGKERINITYPKGLVWNYFRYLDSNYATYDIVYGCVFSDGQYQGTVVSVYSRLCRFRNDVLEEAISKLKELEIDAELVNHYGEPECCNEPSSTPSSVI